MEYLGYVSGSCNQTTVPSMQDFSRLSQAEPSTCFRRAACLNRGSINARELVRGVYHWASDAISRIAFIVVPVRGLSARSLPLSIIIKELYL